MFQTKLVNLSVFFTLGLLANLACGREWTSASGTYKLDGEAISFSETMVVLKKPTGELVAIELDELSKEDQEYVKSKEVTDAHQKSADEMQTWTAKDGMKVRGRIAAYGRKELVVHRKLNEVYINDKKFSSIDALHQRVLLKILSELGQSKITDEKQLDAWARKLGATAKTYQLEGVLLQLESGDEIGVPFFLFAPEEMAILEPGWELWKERAESDESRNHESFLVRSAAMAYQQDRAATRQIEMLKLDMLGAVAGITAIWQVGLAPGPRTFGRPTSVMITAQNSELAAQMALQRYPGYVLVGVRKASR